MHLFGVDETDFVGQVLDWLVGLHQQPLQPLNSEVENLLRDCSLAMFRETSFQGPAGDAYPSRDIAHPDSLVAVLRDEPQGHGHEGIVHDVGVSRLAGDQERGRQQDRLLGRRFSLEKLIQQLGGPVANLFVSHLDTGQ